MKSKKEGTTFKIHRADFREGIVYNVANDYEWELRRRVLLAPPPPNSSKLTGAPFSEPVAGAAKPSLLDSELADLEKSMEPALFEGDYVTTQLADLRGLDGASALAVAWRSGRIVVARGGALEVYNAHEVAADAREAFNLGGARSCQDEPAELTRPLVEYLVTSVPLPPSAAGAAAAVRLCLDEESEALAVGLGDGQLLVCRHLDHLALRGAGGGAEALCGVAGAPPVGARTPLAWARGYLLVGGGGGVVPQL